MLLALWPDVLHSGFQDVLDNLESMIKAALSVTELSIRDLHEVTDGRSVDSVTWGENVGHIEDLGAAGATLKVEDINPAAVAGPEMVDCNLGGSK